MSQLLRQVYADGVEELREDNPDVSPAVRQQVRLTKVYQLLHGDGALVTRLL